MMRLWANSYAKSTPVMTSATLSVVAHTVIIAGVGGVDDADRQHAAGELREPDVLHSSARPRRRHARFSRNRPLSGSTQGRPRHRRRSANHRR